MKTLKSCIVGALFSLLAASQAWAQDIVGAWTRGDTTKEGSAVIVFLANGRVYNIENARAADAPTGFDGVEVGAYTWNAATGALTVTLSQDGNGDIGVGRLQSTPGTFTLSGDTGTLTIPGFRTDALTRVIGDGPIVGAWTSDGRAYAGELIQTRGVVVFLPNGVYFQADEYSMEHGTYSWSRPSAYLTVETSPAPYIDNMPSSEGLSNRVGAWGALVSADNRTLAVDFDGWFYYEFTRVGAAKETPIVPNYQGMWVVPNLAEAGWGINFTHQGDLIFASWFTYDATGKPWWLTMTAQQEADGSFTGAIDRTTGPPFNAVQFDPARVIHSTVGTGRLTFNDADNAMFAYTVNGVSQTKSLTRFQFAAPMPACEFDSTLAPSDTFNFQDMWEVPDRAETGWGINLTHQGDLIFASWFTYDLNGNPFWVTATLTRYTGPSTEPTRGVYRGAIDATTGPAFDSVPFDPSRVTHRTVGTTSVTFTDGANAKLAYTLNGVSQTKPLTRFVFRGRGTVCY